MRKTFLILAAALIAAAPVASAVTATPTEAAQKEIKKGGNKGGGKKAQASKKVAPKGHANKNKNNNKVRSTQVRGGNSRHNNRYARNHNNNRHHHHYYNNKRYYYRQGYGWGWWAPSAFAAGVVTGAVVATPRVYAAPTVTYYEGAANRVESTAGAVPPAGGYAAFSPGWYEYCSSKYRSFDPNTGTYTGYDGLTHYCQ